VVEIINCYGCGALVKDIEGKPHKYLGAPQGCWNIYGEVLAKEYGEYNYPKTTHRLTVDTYSVQHPGQPERRTIQSLNIHLIGLYSVLVKNLSGLEATDKISNILANSPVFEWLEPPVPNGRKTVLNVLTAANKDEHERLVREWAHDVFACWYSKHKQTIDEFAKIYF